MDSSFIELFQDFFLKIVLLNYKINTQIPFNETDEKVIKTLKTLIPIYNRMIDETITSKTLQEINNLNDSRTISKSDIKKANTDNDDSEYMFMDLNSDDNVSETINKTLENTDSDEIDIEGDKLVLELTAKSLKNLEKYIEQNIIFVVDEEDSEDNDSSGFVSSDEYVSESLSDMSLDANELNNFKMCFM
jgi:hypothetical protein